MDILKLRDWYRTPTGHLVRRNVQDAFNRAVEDATGKRILIIGFGIPYIKLLLKEAQVFCAIPQYMGGFCWPNHEPNRVTLVEEENLPFVDGFFDLIIMVHALEFSKDEQATLDECNRCLNDSGRMITIVPNRAGAWSHREISPLARGKPYSTGQLSRTFKQSNFWVSEINYALYTPPSEHFLIHKYSQTFEKIGQRWRAPMGGVIIMSAKKDFHAGIVVRTEQSKRKIRLTPAQA